MPGVMLRLLACACLALSLSAEPVRVIFDTDIGNDVDDAMALAILHALENRGESRLLAVTITKDNRHAAPFIDLMNRFYGRSAIPIGMVRNGVTREDGKYLRPVLEARNGSSPRYAQGLEPGAANLPEAMTLLRQTLAQQPDGSVVLVMVGFSTNCSRLLDSPPDAASPLTGRELVRQKVRLLSTMAGAFSPALLAKNYSEYNIKEDLPAARKLFAEWPTPIVASGFEIGEGILHPGRSMRDDYAYVPHHPVRDAYEQYRGLGKDQPTFDLTSVIYAVRPERGYFGLSAPGTITVDEKGVTRFAESANGKHRYLLVTPEQKERVREAQVLLCSEPPRLTVQ